MSGRSGSSRQCSTARLGCSGAAAAGDGWGDGGVSSLHLPCCGGASRAEVEVFAPLRADGGGERLGAHDRPGVRRVHHLAGRTTIPTCVTSPGLCPKKTRSPGCSGRRRAGAGRRRTVPARCAEGRSRRRGRRPARARSSHSRSGSRRPRRTARRAARARTRAPRPAAPLGAAVTGAGLAVRRCAAQRRTSSTYSCEWL